jgi:hypothetical protein
MHYIFNASRPFNNDATEFLTMLSPFNKNNKTEREKKKTESAAAAR